MGPQRCFYFRDAPANGRPGNQAVFRILCFFPGFSVKASGEHPKGETDLGVALLPTGRPFFELHGMTPIYAIQLASWWLNFVWVTVPLPSTQPATKGCILFFHGIPVGI